MAEVRRVSGAEHYFVSDAGFVYSDRAGRLRRLKPWLNSTGYQVVSVAFGETRKKCFVHRLVAEAFLPPPAAGQDEVMHKDDCPANNAASNLRWGTHADNMRQMSERGRSGTRSKPHRVPRGARHGSKTKPHSVPRGERNGSSVITEAHVRAIRAMMAVGLSTSAIARALDIPRGAAKCVAQGKTWRHVGA